MNTVCIIQARMGSERLPGKVLKDIEGEPMLERILDRLTQAELIDRTIVATSVSEQDNSIEDFCRARAIPVFRGSENDVLSRYFETARQYDPDIVVRVTADCPLVDYQGIDRLIKVLKEDSSLDYVTFSNEEIPRGLTGEVFTFQALKKTYKNARESYEREHVTIHMYQHSAEFKIKYLEPPQWLKRPEFRLTVDTPEDLELVRKVYNYIMGLEITRKDNRYVDVVDLLEVIRLLDKYPEIAQINRHVRQKDPISGT